MAQRDRPELVTRFCDEEGRDTRGMAVGMATTVAPGTCRHRIPDNVVFRGSMAGHLCMRGLACAGGVMCCCHAHRGFATRLLLNTDGFIIT